MPLNGVYVLGSLSNPANDPATAAKDLAASSFDYVVLASFHVSGSGVISWNNTEVSALNQNQIDAVKTIKDSGKKIYCSFGGGGMFNGHAIGYWDFTHIGDAMNAFLDNLGKLLTLLDADGFDNDLEVYGDYTPFTKTVNKVNKWLAKNGYGITLAPYEAIDFWMTILKAAEIDGEQRVNWINLQNAGVNEINQWAKAVTYVGVSAGSQFISAGLQMDGMSPAVVESQFAGIASASPGGGWLWNYGNFAGNSATAYSDAVVKGLSS